MSGKAGGARRMATVALGTILIGWLVLVVTVWIIQDALIYFPTRDVPPPEGAPLRAATAEEVAFAAEGGVKLHGWLVSPRGATAPAAVVVLFHGNGGNMSGRAPKADAFARAGCATFLFDYRGYGLSEGKPSEEGLYRDGRAAARWARARLPDAPLVFYGESLGCAVAIETALSERPRAIALESPFASLAAIGRHHYPWLPVGLLLRSTYDNIGKAPRLDVPALVVVGERDRTIPPAMGRAIHEAIPGGRKRFLSVPDADHNDFFLIDFNPIVKEVLGLLSPPVKEAR